VRDYLTVKDLRAYEWSEEKIEKEYSSLDNDGKNNLLELMETKLDTVRGWRGGGDD
jgi:hypothetical protein